MDGAGAAGAVGAMVVPCDEGIYVTLSDCGCVESCVAPPSVLAACENNLKEIYIGTTKGINVYLASLTSPIF